MRRSPESINRLTAITDVKRWEKTLKNVKRGKNKKKKRLKRYKNVLSFDGPLHANFNSVHQCQAYVEKQLDSKSVNQNRHFCNIRC